MERQNEIDEHIDDLESGLERKGIICVEENEQEPPEGFEDLMYEAWKDK